MAAGSNLHEEEELEVRDTPGGDATSEKPAPVPRGRRKGSFILHFLMLLRLIVRNEGLTVRKDGYVRVSDLVRLMSL
jgi:hypothetical protein